MRIKDSLALFEHSGHTTRWMRAYFLGYFPVMCIGAVLDINRFTLFFLQGRLDGIQFAAILASALFCIGSGIAAFVAMQKLTPAGYRLNLLHMGLAMLCFACVNATDAWLLGSSLGYTVWLAIFFLAFLAAWAYPNYVYFQKRRELFRAYSPDEIETATKKLSHLLTNAKIKAVLQASGRNTRWLQFYLFTYMPVIAALSVFGLAAFRILPVSVWSVAAQGQWVTLLLLLVSYGFTLIKIAAFVHMRELSLDGFWWNMALLWAELIYRILQVIFVDYPKQAANPYRLQLLGGVVLLHLLIWFLPNMIYFTKRRELFRPYADEELRLAQQYEPQKQSDLSVPKRSVHRGLPASVKVKKK